MNTNQVMETLSKLIDKLEEEVRDKQNTPYLNMYLRKRE